MGGRYVVTDIVVGVTACSVQSVINTARVRRGTYDLPTAAFLLPLSGLFAFTWPALKLGCTPGAGTSLTPHASGTAVSATRNSTNQTKFPPNTWCSTDNAKMAETNAGAMPRAMEEQVCWRPNMEPSWSERSTEDFTIIMLSLFSRRGVKKITVALSVR